MEPDLIDVGGESTRPGSKAISEQLEWHRISTTLKTINKKKNTNFFRY